MPGVNVAIIGGGRAGAAAAADVKKSTPELRFAIVKRAPYGLNGRQTRIAASTKSSRVSLSPTVMVCRTAKPLRSLPMLLTQAS